jgi:hypothetical protein
LAGSDCLPVVWRSLILVIYPETITAAAARPRPVGDDQVCCKAEVAPLAPSAGCQWPEL